MSSERKIPPLINIKQAAVYYSKQLILEDLSLELPQGERIAVLGKSGAGKSTLLKLLYQHLVDKNHSVAWVPQQLGLVNNLSAFHNVYMGDLDKHSRWYNLLNLLWPQARPKHDIQQLLADFKLEEDMFKPVAELSGGQQQRVAIARAIYSKADTILADEPASSLDGPMADKVIDSLLRHSNSTIIALHNTEQAMQFADRIIGIHCGKIVLNDSPNAIDPSQLEPLYDHE